MTVVHLNVGGKSYVVAYQKAAGFMEGDRVNVIEKSEDDKITAENRYTITRGTDIKMTLLWDHRYPFPENAVCAAVRRDESFPLFGGINDIEQEAMNIIVNLYVQTKDPQTRLQLKSILAEAQRLAKWGLVKNAD